MAGKLNNPQMTQIRTPCSRSPYGYADLRQIDFEKSRKYRPYLCELFANSVSLYLCGHYPNSEEKL